MKTTSAVRPNNPSASAPSSIQPRSLREQIVEVLQDAIISGEYQPGQRMVEREFVARFGVSSIPVREALQELENRGLVVKRHHRGCTVVQLTREQEQQMCNIRALIEPEVVKWAVERGSQEQKERLLSLAKNMSNAGAAQDYAEYFRHDIAFHRMLWTMSGNEYASRVLEPVVGSLFAMSLLRVKEATVTLPKEVAKHVKIAEAALRGEADVAKDLLMNIVTNYEQFTGAKAAQR